MSDEQYERGQDILQRLQVSINSKYDRIEELEECCDRLRAAVTEAERRDPSSLQLATVQLNLAHINYETGNFPNLFLMYVDIVFVLIYPSLLSRKIAEDTFGDPVNNTRKVLQHKNICSQHVTINNVLQRCNL
jgi:hypothetical protein